MSRLRTPSRIASTRASVPYRTSLQLRRVTPAFIERTADGLDAVQADGLDDDAFLAAFARRHGIRRLALYGSALRGDIGPMSDLDILVEFIPGHTPGLITLASMELELESAIGRTVELRTYEDLSAHFRDHDAASARSVYGA